MRYRGSVRKTINQDEWVEGPFVISFDVQARRRDEGWGTANAVYRSILQSRRLIQRLPPDS